jgi:hypothetical protein
LLPFSFLYYRSTAVRDHSHFNIVDQDAVYVNSHFEIVDQDIVYDDSHFSIVDQDAVYDNSHFDIVDQNSVGIYLISKLSIKTHFVIIVISIFSVKSNM